MTKPLDIRSLINNFRSRYKHDILNYEDARLSIRKKHKNPLIDEKIEKK